MQTVDHQRARFLRECREQLRRCGIELDVAKSGEHENSVFGQLGPNRFQKGSSYYWIVTCKVPLEVAEEMYATVVGNTDIRCAGHCGCPEPKTQVEWHTRPDNRFDNKQIWNLANKIELEAMVARNSPCKESAERSLRECLYTDNPEELGKPYIMSYHIDTELGLYIFVQTLKKYGLDKHDANV